MQKKSKSNYQKEKTKKKKDLWTIRSRAWYGHFEDILMDLKKCPKNDWDLLLFIYKVLNRYQAFGYYHIASSAYISALQVLDDKLPEEAVVRNLCDKNAL